MKEKLSNQPVLYAPNYSKPFLLQTDASNVGIGIVLAQKDEKNNEQKYSTTEEECAAIVWRIKKLNYCLSGQKFTIPTDHNLLI